MPIRVFGNTTVENDKFWETLFVGGSYADETYNPIYNENYMDIIILYLQFHIRKREAAVTSARNAIGDQIQITFKYNKYLPEYQQRIRTLDSETLIPNFYLLGDVQTYDIDEEDKHRFNGNIINFLTLEGDYPSVGDMLGKSVNGNADAIDVYLSSSYVNAEISASTRTYIKSKLKNIYLDNVF